MKDSKPSSTLAETLLKRQPKRPTPSVRGWLISLKSAIKLASFRPGPPRREVIRLAAVMSLLGKVEDNKDAYWAIKALFFNNYRTGQWCAALDLISTDVDLERVVEAVALYNTLSTKMIASCRFNLSQVIAVMLQAKNPKALITSCVKGGIDHIGGIFHPNTLRAAERRLRGSLGPLADESATQTTKARVRSIQT